MTNEIRAAFGKNIQVLDRRFHAKASEAYLDVIFHYKDGTKWQGSVPIHYRRTGVEANTKEEIIEVLNNAYKSMDPHTEKAWQQEQHEFWDGCKKEVTREFFEQLKDCKWKCVGCQLPANPNWARRVQDLKEFGYTLSTNTKKYCDTCQANRTHLIMLRIPRGGDGTASYETWSPGLRKKILTALDHFDCFEGRKIKSFSLLPDHKFPEIRWDKEVKEANPEDMSPEQIIKKFQLLSNQRNQQKREACRNCFQTGNRGTPFNISFFYEGGPRFAEGLPKSGKATEKGCIGCGWYDLTKWRQELNKKLSAK